ncbi:hypothetical protein [Streptomyces sp. NPDC093149]|uniref:hypothetical protein n=1 Tax=Streptomyces sp. NPDC093149 TaxID=3366031 RepID=UPI003814D0DD
MHGSQGKVAKRLGKTAAWVSQRLALLELTPELQDKVEAGELKVEPARRIGRLPKEQQAAAAAETVNAVNTSAAEAADETSAAPTVNAVNSGGSACRIGSARYLSGVSRGCGGRAGRTALSD